MERELIATGIGGQGVQLAAQVIARAATLEDRNVMVFGMYGGEMRGGTTEATVVVADQPIEAPPIVSRTWSAIAMHHTFWEKVRAAMRPGGLVLVNSNVFAGPLDRDAYRVVELAVHDVATDAGNELAGSMVMVGAYVALTAIVELESAVEAMRRSLPPYRQQHAEVNERAIRAGATLVDHGAVPAWAVVPA